MQTVHTPGRDELCVTDCTTTDPSELAASAPDAPVTVTQTVPPAGVAGIEETLMA